MKDDRKFYNYVVTVEGLGTHKQRDINELNAVIAVFTRLQLIGLSSRKFTVIREDAKVIKMEAAKQ